jgi:hypothetical protein
MKRSGLKFFLKWMCPDPENFGSSITWPAAARILRMSLKASPITALTKHQLSMKIDPAKGYVLQEICGMVGKGMNFGMCRIYAFLLKPSASKWMWRWASRYAWCPLSKTIIKLGLSLYGLICRGSITNMSFWGFLTNIHQIWKNATQAPQMHLIEKLRFGSKVQYQVWRTRAKSLSSFKRK